MIGALLSEGVSALRDARAASERRVASGLDRSLFINVLLAGAVVTLASMIVPELSGISSTTDRMMGDEPSAFMLTWPILPSMTAALALVTMALVLQGPRFTRWLSLKLGGQSDLMDAAIWIYLASLAGIVISLGIIAIDAILGLASMVLPPSIGWVSIAAALIGFIATLTVCAQLAQHLFRLPSYRRRLAFAALWIGGWVLLFIAIWLPIYLLLGGPTS
ncbi:MAG: hypothetical protein ACRDBH_01400 [Bosea sp. (in: a-proteobacteria)]